MRIVVDNGNVEAVLAQLEAVAGLKFAIAPNQSFASPISFYATGSPWEVMDCLQATNTVTFTLENGVWVVRSPVSRFIRIYNLVGVPPAQYAEARQMLTRIQTGDRTARVSYSPDQAAITVEAGVDFQFKVWSYLMLVDTAVRTNTPLMVVVERLFPAQAGQIALQEVPATK